MTNKILLSVFFVVFVIASIFGSPSRYIGPIIEESEIPMPEVQYELPETLIGEFVMASGYFDIQITIFPNNKYIILLYNSKILSSVYYGYIVKNNDAFYFSPSPKGNYSFFDKLTEIHLTDSGFFFYHWNYGIVRSIRKENMPVPEHLAEDVSVPFKFIKQQYFSFDGTEAGRIDFNEIEFIEQWNPLVIESWYHCLWVNNGIVDIIRYIGTGKEPRVVDGVPRIEAEGYSLFAGFLEKTEESDNVTKGIIRFTNGVPYYYISDGTAGIEINSDGGIIITMFYSPDQDTLNEIEIPDGLEFPAKLILEF
jgi:hypothetical protein